MNEENPSRRAVLRGALAVGCGLWIPIVFSGCDAKKGADAGSSTPGTSPAGSANPATPAATKKVSQVSVHYQPQPKGELKCQDCVNFIAGSSTCKLVEGQVSPDGWCSLWTKKA